MDTTTVLTVVTAAVFGLGGIAAAVAAPPLSVTWDALGISDQLGRATGVLEIAAATGLVISLRVAPGLGLAAATGLALLMVGAVTYHVRAGDRAGAAPPAVLGALSVATAAVIGSTL